MASSILNSWIDMSWWRSELNLRQNDERSAKMPHRLFDTLDTLFIRAVGPRRKMDPAKLVR